MHLVRYARADDPEARLGVAHDGVRPVESAGVGDLLARPLDEIRRVVGDAVQAPPVHGEVMLLPPVDGRMEVWAAGVTYHRSRQARVEESVTADVYELVYAAERPELFFKSVPWRTVTHGEPVSIRRDSGLDVPEPELAVMVNSAAEIVAYGICDDVSSRRIEGDNPLYLPQAKVYAGACALSAGFRPAWEVASPGELGIDMEIERDGVVAWKGHTTTAEMHRTPPALIDYLFREEQFPQGVVISTGTGIVPDMDFTLHAGDVVTIRIDSLGVLSNPVVAGRGHLAWLVDAAGDPTLRNPGFGGPLTGRFL